MRTAPVPSSFRSAARFTDPVPLSVVIAAAFSPCASSPRLRFSPSMVTRSPRTVIGRVNADAGLYAIRASPIPSAPVPSAALSARIRTCPAAVIGASTSTLPSASMKTLPPELLTVVSSITSSPAAREMSPVALRVFKSRSMASMPPPATAERAPSLAVTWWLIRRSPPFFAVRTTDAPETVSTTRAVSPLTDPGDPARLTAPAASITAPSPISRRPPPSLSVSAAMVTSPPEDFTVAPSRRRISSSETTDTFPTATRSSNCTVRGSSMSISSAEVMVDPPDIENIPVPSPARSAVTLTEPVPSSVDTSAQVSLSAPWLPRKTPSPSKITVSPATSTSCCAPREISPSPDRSVSALSRTAPPPMTGPVTSMVCSAQALMFPLASRL